MTDLIISFWYPFIDMLYMYSKKIILRNMFEWQLWLMSASHFYMIFKELILTRVSPVKGTTAPRMKN